MRFAFFVHSLLSDWNHGNAHFLRGIVGELRRQGHRVRVYEPADGWSLRHLIADHGPRALRSFRRAYPGLASHRWRSETLDLDHVFEEADVVIAHEWNDPGLIARLGERRARAPGVRLLFHDTHHRAATRPDEMARYDLSAYDGVLAFGRVLRDLWCVRGVRAWTWHEAADVRVFHPVAGEEREADLVWVGNWGDDERTRELEEFLLDPVRTLGLSATVHGVRYPEEARRALDLAGIRFGGWLANAEVPRVFARHAVTVHVPRRPYARALPGIPTIRVFEALACGIPLVCAPWEDTEGLFTPGEDYLVARDGGEMREHLRALLADPGRAQSLAAHGIATIHARHTCAHRVRELFAVLAGLGLADAPAPEAPHDPAAALATHATRDPITEIAP